MFEFSKIYVSSIFASSISIASIETDPRDELTSMFTFGSLTDVSTLIGGGLVSSPMLF